MKNKKYKNIAVILAGGSGSRMKSLSKLKQFLKIGNKTIIQKSIEIFKNSNLIDKIIITLPINVFDIYSAEIQKYGFGNFIDIIPGGTARQDSSYNAIKHIQSIGGADVVLIHDAARPFITDELILNLITSAKSNGAAITAVPTIDTLIESDGLFLTKQLNRKIIYNVQTPQAFKFSLILEAHEEALTNKHWDLTDDAQLVLKINKPVAIVLGSYDNIKVTNPIDYELAKIIQNNIRNL